MEESIEDSFLLKTLQFNNRRYSIGLFNKEGLFVKEECIKSTIKTGDSLRSFEFNMKTKEVKVVGDEGVTITSNDNDNTNKISSIIDLNEDGVRWEGIIANGNPFGYGSLYTSSNELTHKGVMIGDKKECFGIEFYSGLSQIEYIGCYCNNERHGFGMLYDRKGELVYEGDWLYGSNEFERSVILKDTDNERMVHSLIHELIIDEEVGNDYKDDLLLCGFGHLEKVEVKKNSLKNVNCLKISDNCVLKSIEIEDGEWNEGTFYSIKSLIISSNLIDN